MSSHRDPHRPPVRDAMKVFYVSVILLAFIFTLSIFFGHK